MLTAVQLRELLEGVPDHYPVVTEVRLTESDCPAGTIVRAVVNETAESVEHTLGVGTVVLVLR